jgi:hypothetical protein
LKSDGQFATGAPSGILRNGGSSAAAPPSDMLREGGRATASRPWPSESEMPRAAPPGIPIEGTHSDARIRPAPESELPRAAPPGISTERTNSDGPQAERPPQWRYFDAPKFVLSKFCRGTMAIVFGLAVWVCPHPAPFYRPNAARVHYSPFICPSHLEHTISGLRRVAPNSAEGRWPSFSVSLYGYVRTLQRTTTLPFRPHSMSTRKPSPPLYPHTRWQLFLVSLYRYAIVLKSVNAHH